MLLKAADAWVRGHDDLSDSAIRATARWYGGGNWRRRKKHARFQRLHLETIRRGYPAQSLHVRHPLVSERATAWHANGSANSAITEGSGTTTTTAEPKIIL